MKKIYVNILMFSGILISTSAFSQLDPTFDTDGVNSLPLGDAGACGRSVIVQNDGKILIAGHSHHLGSANDLTLLRYLSDGTLDPTFSGDGIAHIVGVEDEIGLDLEIQSDGKIVVGGYSGSLGYSHFMIARFNSDGTLDNSFGGDGIVTTAIGTNDIARSLIIQTDGKYVLAGSTDTLADSDFALVRYNTDGSLDNTFGINGIVQTDLGSAEDVGKAIVLQSDGKFAVAGVKSNGTYIDFAVVRYNSDGTLDNSFDSDGIVLTPTTSDWSDNLTASIQPDGKILVGGNSGGWMYFGDFIIMRYNTNGSLDNTFDSDGIVTTDFGGNEVIYTLLIQPDNKIVAVGSTYVFTSVDFAVARYHTNGSLDNTFSADGKLATDISTANEVPTGAVFQADSKLVVSGYMQGGSNQDFVVARYGSFILNLNEEPRIEMVSSPNPTTGLFNLQLAENMVNISIVVTDGSGKIVLEKNDLCGDSFILDLSNEPSGIYFLEIRNEDLHQSVKIVKE